MIRPAAARAFTASSTTPPPRGLPASALALGLALALAIVIAGGGCSPAVAVAADLGPRPPDLLLPTLSVTSTGFPSGAPIPVKYAHTMCSGMNVNPPLAWTGAPAATRSFAVLMDDPDATDIYNVTFTHWTAWDLPAATPTVAEGASRTTLSGNEGQNDFGDRGYGGPCPTSKHNYKITIYAIDVPSIGLAPGAGRKDLGGQIAAHTIGAGVLTGTFSP